MSNSKTPQNEGEQDDSPEDESVFEAFAEAVREEDIEAIEAKALEVWQHLAENQPEEPSTWLVAVREATQCEETRDWIGAEEAYKRAIQATHDQPRLQARAYGHLASLYSLVGLDNLALEAEQTASRVIRLENIPSLISFQLQSEARFYLKAKDFERAWDTILEVFTFIGEGPMAHLERVYALILRANYYIQRDEPDLVKAESNLADAWKLMEPYRETYFFAGWQNAFAYWWAIRASLCAKQGQREEAVECWREVVERRRIVAKLPQLEGPYKHNGLAVALHGLGKALQEVGDAQATSCFEESHAIRHSIGVAPLRD